MRKPTGLCSMLCTNGQQPYGNFILGHKNKLSFCAGCSLFARTLGLMNMSCPGMQIAWKYLGLLPHVVWGTPWRKGSWSTWRMAEQDCGNGGVIPGGHYNTEIECPFPCGVHSPQAECGTSAACQEGDPEAKSWVSILPCFSSPCHSGPCCLF